MKSNFKKDTNEKPISTNEKPISTNESKNLSQEDFEKFMSESGASGSFMIYRSKNKDNEMGFDEL